LTLVAGDAVTDVTVREGWNSWSRRVAPGEARTISIRLDEGFPYLGSRIWPVSIESNGGFIPMFGRTGSTDNRYLGIRVIPELYP
jgi:hypothetical protein